MSMTFNVNVAVCETVTEDDTQTQNLALQKGILDADEFDGILKDRLKAEGYTEDEDGKLVKSEGDMTTVIDIEKGEVKTTVSNTETVEETVTGKGYSHRDSREEGESKAQVDAAKKATEVIARKRQAIREAASQRLVDTEKERSAKLQETLNDVYKEALTRKARRMGQVIDTQDTGEGVNREIVIKVAI